ncbi:hypothetical protein QQS21_006894 [Conoideocrella luteorostrata]|uniref:Erythromycin biosynthesis protein CIII-like C-terminal domain-containing protein n=1 Tax=Conoideocrella luteorostrata TaxID=1105319 RepID=A0AAJ0CLP8_9HYPO|nr:hypothetical protein QQS21_006894 [Conoideocrella luteorostrata]
MAKKLLLLTNVDRGQANVFLAVADALLRTQTQIEIHFATFSGLEAEVYSLWQHVSDKVPLAKPIYFHKIEGLTMEQGIKQYISTTTLQVRDGYLLESHLAPLGFRNTMRAIRDTMPILVPYTGPQMEKIFSSIVNIITTISPDLVLVDVLMTAGLTACYHLGVNFSCLSPNSIKEFSGPTQPKAVSLWKWPALFSGFEYPVPWYLIPLNIFFVLFTGYCFKTDRNIKSVQAHLKTSVEAVLRTPVDLLFDRPAKLKVFVGSLPELDYPLVVPQHVIPCGPILRNPRPVEDDDPELAKWLANGPTIYINLGSICRISEDKACEIAQAIRTVLRTVPSAPVSSPLQVLWKLQKLGSYKVREPGCRIFDILADEFKLDLVRVYSWLTPQPYALLRTGHITCSVHHGGANSYFEAVSSGIPQVVLPQWTDCYDYAQRVRHLGIGRIGNNTSKPQWNAQELAREMLHVLVGRDAADVRNRAIELSHVCQKNGNGSFMVAGYIGQELSR